MSSSPKKNGNRVGKEKGVSDSEASSPEAVPKKLNVVLEHNRSKYLVGAGISVVLGGLCLWKLGMIGQVIGLLFMISALFQGWRALRTFLNKPGTFRVTNGEIDVPTGICTGETLTIKGSQLQHAFFIRRAVPWTQAGPVLVIETGDNAYSFPRDWFSSDSDQLRVCRALRRHIEQPE